MEITIPVRLTEEDVMASACEYYDKNTIMNQKNWLNIRSTIVVFCALGSAGIFLWEIASVIFRSSIFIATIIPLASLFTLNIAIIIYMVQLSKITKRTTIKEDLSHFRTDYSSHILRTYVLSAEGIMDESKTENHILHWEEIYRLAEYPSCFILENSSSVRTHIIPRRCFENEQQLRDFRSIVSSNLPASKWSLKGIPLGISNPDVKTNESFDDPVPFPDQKDSLYSFTFRYTEKEDEALHNTFVRSSCRFKKLVVLLTFLFGMQIWLFLYKPLFWGAIIFIEGYVVFWLIGVFRKAYLKSKLNDKKFELDVTISFFTDRFVISERDGQSQYFWDAISRVKITRAGLLLYLRPSAAHVFPARVINSMPNKDEFKAFIKSRDIAPSNRSRISK